MATNSLANLRKPLRTDRSSKSKSAYKTVEVSCFDLARLLDWCENSVMHLNSDGSTIGISDIEWYRDAHRAISLAFWTCTRTCRRKSR